MWLLTPDGQYSIVKPGPRDGHRRMLMVRSRVAADLDTLRDTWLPALTPTLPTPNRDYQFRAFAKRQDLAEAAGHMVMGIGYTNFKNEVHDRQGAEREDVYHRVWVALLGLGRVGRREAALQQSLSGYDPAWDGDLHDYMDELIG